MVDDDRDVLVVLAIRQRVDADVGQPIEGIGAAEAGYQPRSNGSKSLLASIVARPRRALAEVCLALAALIAAGLVMRSGIARGSPEPSPRLAVSVRSNIRARAVFGSQPPIPSAPRSKNPDPENPKKKGHFIPDHQPPMSVYNQGKGASPNTPNVMLYPHCKRCASKQGGQMSHHADDITPNYKGNNAVNPPPKKKK